MLEMEGNMNYYQAILAAALPYIPEGGSIKISGDTPEATIVGKINPEHTTKLHRAGFQYCEPNFPFGGTWRNLIPVSIGGMGTDIEVRVIVIDSD